MAPKADKKGKATDDFKSRLALVIKLFHILPNLMVEFSRYIHFLLDILGLKYIAIFRLIMADGS